MRRLLCFMLLLFVAHGAAWADTFYSSSAAWNAAVTSTTNVNFEGIVPPNGFNYYGFGPGAGITVGGVQFSVGPAGTDNLLFVLGDGYYGFPVSTIAPQSESGTVNDLLITLPASVTALAFDYSGFVTSGGTTVALSDGVSVALPSYNAPTLQFFGVTSSSGITWVDITVGGLGLNLDGITYGTANPVPEPGSLALTGVGVLAVAGTIRRKFLA